MLRVCYYGCRDVYALNCNLHRQETETQRGDTRVGQHVALSYFWLLLTSSWRLKRSVLDRRSGRMYKKGWIISIGTVARESLSSGNKTVACRNVVKYIKLFCASPLACEQSGNLLKLPCEADLTHVQTVKSHTPPLFTFNFYKAVSL